MAPHLTERWRWRLAASVVLVGTAASASAERLLDPTRPPLAPSAMTSPQTSSTGPLLQSILVSPHRKVAVINGEMVVVGGMVGGAQVAGITETEVILKSGKETQVLRLYSDIGKKPTLLKPATKAGDIKNK